MALVALLKTGGRVGLVVAVIFFSQVFEKKLQRSLSRSGAGMSVMSIQPLIFPWQEALNLCQSNLFFLTLFRFLVVDEVVNFLARIVFSPMINVFVRFFLNTFRSKFGRTMSTSRSLDSVGLTDILSQFSFDLFSQRTI